MRRWSRYLLLLAGVGTVVVGFGLWRLSRDDERLTRWLADSVRSATGLQMHSRDSGSFGFWPQLSVALNDIELRAFSGSSTPARIDSIRVQVPWSSVFGRELHASRVVLRGVDLDAAAISSWLAHRADAGPLPAWRWPELDAALLVEDLRYLSADEAGTPVEQFVLERLYLDRWIIDQPASLSARMHVPALADETLQINLGCTPRQTRNAIAIEPCSASIGVDNRSELAVRGYLRLDDSARSEVQLRIEASALPAWLPVAAMGAQEQPVNIVMRLIGAAAGPLKLKSGGTLADSTLDIDVVLPYGWIDLASAADWTGLADRATGSLSIDKWQQGELQLEDIRWRNEPTNGNATEAGAVPANATAADSL